MLYLNRQCCGEQPPPIPAILGLPRLSATYRQRIRAARNMDGSDFVYTLHLRLGLRTTR